MFLLFFTHYLFQLLFTNSIVFSKELTQLFRPPMVKGTSMMLSLFRSRASNYISALPCIFYFFLTLKTISMFYVIHMSFHLGGCHFTL